MTRYLMLALIIGASLAITDSALARHRRGCAGGKCGVPIAAQAPVQKVESPVQKEIAKGETSPSDQPQAAAAPQRTRRLAGFARLRRDR
jgi:hypothetical protein